MDMDSEDLLSGENEVTEGGDQDLAGVDVDQLLGEEDHTMEEEGGEAVVENATVESEQIKTVENGDEHVQQGDVEADEEGMEDEHTEESPPHQHNHHNFRGDFRGRGD